MRTHRPFSVSHPLALLAALLLLGSGCATATRVAIGDEQRQQIASAQTVAGFSQPEIGAAIEVSTAGGAFGLIGALIDSGVNNTRAKEAEKLIAPVRDALVSYDAAAALGGALTRELDGVAWLKGNKVELRKLTPSATLATDEAKKAEADVVLLVQADYRLGPAFTNLVVTARATLVPAHGPLAPATIPPSGVAPLYKNLLWTLVTLPDLPAGVTREAAAERWARDGGTDARRAMDLAVADLSRMIAWDLQQAGTKGNGSGPKPGYAGATGAQKPSVMGPYGSPAVPAFEVSDEGGRKWMRTAGGDLASCGDLAP